MQYYLSKTMVTLLVTFPLFIACTKSPSSLSGEELNCNLSWGQTDLNKETCAVQSSLADSSTQIEFSIPRWDADDFNLYAVVEVDKVEALKGMRWQFKTTLGEWASYELPMFSDAEFNLIQNNEKAILGFPVSELQMPVDDHSPTFVQGTLFLNARREQQVRVKLLELYLKKKTKTSGVVSLTFDDGFESNYLAGQIANQLGFKGTAYLIPDAIDDQGYLSKEQVIALRKWGWDLASHHETPVTQFSQSDLQQTLESVKEKLQDEFHSESSGHLAYPMGKHSPKTDVTIKNLFSSARLASGGIESLPVANPFRLKVINVLPSMSPQQLYEKALLAQENGDWAIFMFHTLDRPEKGDLNYASENFRAFLDKLKNKSIKVKTVDEVFTKVL